MRHFRYNDTTVLKEPSVNFFYNYSIIHDQLYLPKGILSREEARWNPSAQSWT